MGFFIIGLIITIASIMLYYLNDDDFAMGGVFIGVYILVVTGIITLSTDCSESQFEDEYEILVEELEVYHQSTLKTNYHYLENLDERMTYINDRIETNKKYAGTFWLGWFNSSKIASYKPFNIKKELGQ